jgi:hypothetical protein
MATQPDQALIKILLREQIKEATDNLRRKINPWIF